MRRCHALLLSAAVSMAGCCGASKIEELEQVAKDWSLVVRASQVIPVYPLTEDVQAGDIFLVQTPLENQIELYEEKGFLPLDQLVGRLQPDHYGDFYLKSYGIGERTDTPHHWQFSGNPSGTTEWAKAPHAAFPTYSFSVKRGFGINLAIPVQGVPVALNLMATGSASGSIAIAEALTYGIDVASLSQQVEKWAEDHKLLLARFAPVEDPDSRQIRHYYLRVVNRVFLTGKVNVTLFNDEAAGAALAAGAPKSVDLLDASSHDAAANYANMINALNKSVDMANASLPGGGLKVAAASSRSVSLVETFPRPLVIGYLGFDYAILEDGKLGRQESTHAKLSRSPIIHAPPTTYGIDDNTARIDRWLKGNPNKRQDLRKWLDDQGHQLIGIANVNKGLEYGELRAKIVAHFSIP
jgi:hypothetical protein